MKNIALITSLLLVSCGAWAVPLGQGLPEYVDAQGVQFSDQGTQTAPGGDGGGAPVNWTNVVSSFTGVGVSTAALGASTATLAAMAIDGSTTVIDARVTALDSKAVDGSTTVIDARVTALDSKAVDGSTTVINTRLTLVAASTPTYALASGGLVVYGTALVDVPGCSRALVSGGVYEVDAWLVVQTTATADGYRVDWSGPAVTYVSYTRESMMVTGNSTDGFASRYLAALNGDASIASVNGANAAHASRVHMIIKPSADGTLQLRVAGENATTKTTVTQNGTYIRVVRIQ